MLMCCMVTGCVARRQMYAGPQLPRDKVAWLSVSRAPGNRLSKMIALDGQRIGMPLYDVLEFKPGPHTLAVEVVWSNRYRQRAELTFVAGANATYTIHADETSLPPPPPPSTQREDLATELAGAAAAGAIVGAGTAVAVYTSPIWFPIVVIYLLVSPAPKAPPEASAMTIVIAEKSGTELARWHEEILPKDQQDMDVPH
jgi:hypothetical protein